MPPNQPGRPPQFPAPSGTTPKADNPKLAKPPVRAPSKASQTQKTRRGR